MKPSNVLWCHELVRLQLIDMGMAEAIKDDFVPRFVAYVTRPYRPPELWNCIGPIAKFLAVGVVFGVSGVLFLKWPMVFL